MPRRVVQQQRVTPALRRALFVAFMVLGLFLALAFTNAERANRQLEQSIEREKVTQAQNDLLIARVDRLLASQEQAQRDRDALERLLVRLLAASNDPALAEAFEEIAARDREVERELAEQQGREESRHQTRHPGNRPQASGRAPQGGQEPQERPEPRPTPRPTPQQSPRPPQGSPPPQAETLCVSTGPPLNRRICTPM